ncbi:MAG: hypothetical protein WA005_01740 [Candidatus Binataceae bacterium]
MLRALAATAAVGSFSSSLFGTEYSLYALRELGFRPAILGVIYAVGGASSLCGALLVGRVSARLGSGRAMVLGLVVWGLGELCLPLARGATTLAAALMVVQQLTGGGRPGRIDRLAPDAGDWRRRRPGRRCDPHVLAGADAE